MLLAAALAIVAVPEMRAAFRRRAAWIAPLTLLALVSPHLWWVRNHAALATERLYILREGGGPLGMNLRADSVVDGLVSFLLVVLVCVLPALAIFFGAKFFAPAAPTPKFALRKFAALWLVAEFFALVAIVLAGGIYQVHERYLLVLLPPFAFWISLRFDFERKARAASVVLGAALFVALFISAARPLTIIYDSSRLAWPYAQMEKEIAPAVPTPIALLGDRVENSANLAIRWPGAEMFDRRQPARRVLLVADDAVALAKLREQLGAGYRALDEMKIIRASLRWQATRRVSLAAQTFERVR